MQNFEMVTTLDGTIESRSESVRNGKGSLETRVPGICGGGRVQKGREAQKTRRM